MPVTRPRDKSSRWEPAHAHRTRRIPRLGPAADSPRPATTSRFLASASLALTSTALSLLTLVSLLTLAACTGATPPASDSPGATPAAEAPAPAGLAQARAAEQTRKIMEAVAKARALPVTGKVGVEVMQRAEIRDFAKTAMYEHHSREQIRMFTRIESAMGVLPLGADGEAILLDMLEVGVMGLYEPKKKTLFIGTHVSDGQLDMVVGHEIAHGLQDMHFGLERLQQPIRGDSDAEAARTYLVEGDAQAAYLAWVSGAAGLASISPEVMLVTGNQALDLADLVDYPVLARSLQLPYADGAMTIAALVRAQGWPAVDALYSALPTTTEQMLHLDKLLAREAAVAVVADPAALAAQLPGQRVVWQDNLGEASLLTMLADVEPAPVARAAAAGWGGDRYLALERDPAGAAPLIVGLIAWDSEADAEEFAATFRLYLEKAMPDAFILQRRGDQLRFAAQVRDAATRDALATHAWSAFTVAGKPAGTRITSKLAASPTPGRGAS